MKAGPPREPRRPAPRREGPPSTAARRAEHSARHPAPPPVTSVRLTPGTRRGVLVALLAVWCVLFAPQLFTGRVFVLGDATAYRPFADFSRQRWHETGELTNWNPYVFLGVPARASLADSRPQWLPGPLLSAWDGVRDAPFLPPLWPLLLAHLAGMTSMAALARALWRCGPVPMALAGASWGLMPVVLVPFAFGHDAQLWTLSLLPLALWLVHGTVGAAITEARLFALALAATLGLQMLAGHPQFVAYTAALVVLLALERALGRQRPARLLLVGGAIAGGALLSAAVWWPMIQYAAGSVRSLPDFAKRELLDFSGNVRDLVAVVWPHAAGFGGDTYWGGLRRTDYPNYAGVLAVAFALRGTFSRRRDGARVVAILLSAIAAFGALASLGSRLPPLAALLGALPFGQSFRTPVTWLTLTLFAVALLAARGAEALVEATRAGRWRLATASAAALVVAVGLTVGMHGGLARAVSEGMSMSRASAMPGGGAANAVVVDDAWAKSSDREGPVAVDDLRLRLALLALAAAAVAAVARMRPSAATAMAAGIAVLAVFDAALVVRPILARATGPASALRAPAAPPLAAAARADARHRVYPFDTGEFFANTWVAWRARSVGGLHGAVPLPWEQLRANGLFMRDGFVRSVSVKYVAGGSFRLDDSTRWERLPGGVLARRDALPRAYAVPHVRVAPEDALLIAALSDARFDPADQAFTREPAAGGDYPGSAGATIGWSRDDPDRIELVVTAADRAFVVLADLWDRGWAATLDGAPATIHRVNLAVRGVVVPAGRHVIVMRYEPPGAAAGAAVSRAAWLLLLAALGLLAWKRAAGGRPGAQVAAAAALSLLSITTR